LQVLRRVLGDEALPNRGTGVCVDPAHLRADLTELEAAIARGDATRALSLFREDLLQGLVVPGAAGFMAWLDERRQALRRDVASLAADQSRLAEHAGRLDEALSWAHREAQLLPLEERPVSRLTALLGRGGAPDAAEAVYDAYATRLAMELDDAPSSALQVRQVRRGAHRVVTTSSTKGTTPSGQPMLRVCVMPLVTLGDDATIEDEGAWFSDELASALAEAHADGLEVVARSRAPAMQAPDAVALGRLVDAAVVIDGVLRAERGGTRRLLLRLHDVRRNAVRWGRRYRYRPDALTVWQDRVTREVAEAMHRILRPEGRWLAQHRRSADPDVHLLWLRATHHLWRRTPRDVSRALELLQDVVARDPALAAGWEGLAHAWSLMPIYASCPATEAMPKAREAADRAIALDAAAPFAHAIRGLVASSWEWNLSAAARHFAEAQRLGPSEAAVHTAAMLYLHTARGNRAAVCAAAQRSLALDPLNPLALAYAALAASYVDALEESVRWGTEALELEPAHTVAHWAMARARSLRLEHEAALAHADTLLELTHGAPLFAATRAAVLARSGQAARARHALRALIRRRPDVAEIGVPVASAWCALGEATLAKRALEAAIASRSSGVITAGVDPLLVCAATDLRVVARAAIAQGSVSHVP